MKQVNTAFKNYNEAVNETFEEARQHSRSTQHLRVTTKQPTEHAKQAVSDDKLGLLASEILRPFKILAMSLRKFLTTKSGLEISGYVVLMASLNLPGRNSVIISCHVLPRDSNTALFWS